MTIVLYILILAAVSVGSFIAGMWLTNRLRSNQRRTGKDRLSLSVLH